MRTSIPVSSLYPLLGLSASAFLFNTSEFMPIGLLLDISQSFGMSPGHTGIMITLYAWFVGFLSLPLMLATCRMAPKRLLLFTMALFVIGQAGSGLAVNFPMLVAFRIVVACAIRSFGPCGPVGNADCAAGASAFCPFHGRNGYIHCHDLGAPLGAAHWSCPWVAHDLPVPFLCFPIGHGLSVRIFPVLTQGAPFTLHDLPGLLRNPIVMGVSFLALLYAGSYFTVYSYIEPFLETVAHFSAQGITWTLVFLGVCGIGGSAVFFRFYEARRQPVFTLNWGPFLRSWCSFCRQRPSADYAPLLHGLWHDLYHVRDHYAGRTHPWLPPSGSACCHGYLFGHFQRGDCKRHLAWWTPCFKGPAVLHRFAGAVLAVGATLVACAFTCRK